MAIFNSKLLVYQRLNGVVLTKKMKFPIRRCVFARLLLGSHTYKAALEDMHTAPGLVHQRIVSTLIPCYICLTFWQDKAYCFRMIKDKWSLLMKHNDIWYMMIYADIWWYMMIYYDICWYMMISLMSLISSCNSKKASGIKGSRCPAVV